MHCVSHVHEAAASILDNSQSGEWSVVKSDASWSHAVACLICCLEFFNHQSNVFWEQAVQGTAPRGRNRRKTRRAKVYGELGSSKRGSCHLRMDAFVKTEAARKKVALALHYKLLRMDAKACCTASCLVESPLRLPRNFNMVV